MRFVDAIFYILAALCFFVAVFVDLHIGLVFAIPLFFIRGIIALFVKK